MTLQDRVDLACKHAYSLALILAFLCIALTPVQMFATHHANVARVLPDHTIEVHPTDPGALSVGDEVQVYRFNPGWKREIGTATVVSLEGDRWTMSYDPDRFRFEMGRQGTVVERTGSTVQLDLGAEVGLAPNTQMILFDERERVGAVQVVSASPGQATARITQLRRDRGPQELVGLTASEFSIPNQVAWVGKPLVTKVEAGVLVAGVLVWLWSLFSTVPGRAYFGATAQIRHGLRRAADRSGVVGLALLGGVVCGVIVPVLTHFFINAAQELARRSSYALSDPTWIADWTPWITLAAWLAWVALKRRNPLADLWDALRYPNIIPRIVFPRLDLDVGLRNWGLHWIVFYMFASALLGFIKGNLGAMAQIGWAEAGLSFETWTAIFVHSLPWMLTHAPDVPNLDAFFSLCRYGLWTACIVGSLIGYGHSLLFGWYIDPDPQAKDTDPAAGLAIRHVDFTITAWTLNLICYDPWARGTYRFFPSPTGADPTIIRGALQLVQLSAELFLNLLYTLSIFNMGKRFGVMVDKGMVTRGFFSVVRHPSYTLEALMFTVMHLNGVSTPYLWIGLIAHPLLYWMRSERDEQFMSDANPAYGPYREKVRWKYIPGIH